MEALELLLATLANSNPLVVLVILVLGFLFVMYSLGRMALRTIQNLSKRGGEE